jgi:glycosyltransferase involved in cell wall biosynthesis
MNLVYVVKRFPKYSETFVLHEIQELRAQGERVTVCSLLGPHPGEPRHEGTDAILATTHYVPRGLHRLFRLAAASLSALVLVPARAWPALGWSLRWAGHERSVAQLKRFGEAAYLRTRIPADTEHIHAHFAHGPASVALLLSRLTGLPFSFTGHAKDIFELVDPQLLGAKVHEARLVVTVSECTRRHVAQSVDAGEQAKVVVVRNGIDRRTFHARREEPDGPPLIVSVGRLVMKKGLDTLVDACAVLAARGVDFRCEVIGEGPFRAELESRARRLGVDDRVAFIGSRDDRAVRAAYDRATVFVLPCRPTPTGDRDGLPVSLVEAMVVGLPVVTTPVTGIPEIVRNAESGILVPPDDPDEVAAALESLLSQPELRARLAAGAREAADAYDLSACVGRLRTLFLQPPVAA